MKMSLVLRRETSLLSLRKRRKMTTGWRGSLKQSLTEEGSSPPPLSTCYQTDHQPCLATSEELTQHNQERLAENLVSLGLALFRPLCQCAVRDPASMLVKVVPGTRRSHPARPLPNLPPIPHPACATLQYGRTTTCIPEDCQGPCTLADCSSGAVCM